MNKAIANEYSFKWHYKVKLGVIKETFKTHGTMQKDDQFMTGSEHQPMRVYSVFDQKNIKTIDYQRPRLIIKII